MKTLTASVKKRILLKLPVLVLLLLCYNYGCISGSAALSENESTENNRKKYQTIYSDTTSQSGDVTYTNPKRGLRGHTTVLK